MSFFDWSNMNWRGEIVFPVMVTFFILVMCFRSEPPDRRKRRRGYWLGGIAVVLVFLGELWQTEALDGRAVRGCLWSSILVGTLIMVCSWVAKAILLRLWRDAQSDARAVRRAWRRLTAWRHPTTPNQARIPADRSDVEQRPSSP